MHNIIIPCCGNGLRFGTDSPKHLVDIGGRPMVQRVIDRLPTWAAIYVVVRREHYEHTLAVLGPTGVIVNQCSDPVSVCHTVLAVPLDTSEEKVLVINCDNVIDPAMGWERFFHDYKNAIMTFNTKPLRGTKESPFSHVRVTSGRVLQVAEKKRIGAQACAGAFLFEDMRTMRWLCTTHLTDPPDHNGEHYLAPVYNRILEDKGTHVAAVLVGADGIFLRMGTPEEAAVTRRFYVR